MNDFYSQYLKRSILGKNKFKIPTNNGRQVFSLKRLLTWRTNGAMSHGLGKRRELFS